MIHVVTLANQHLYGHQLDQMFRMRHDFYVKDHDWDGVVSINGRETDEFDDGDVVYLISIDRFGEVAGAYRANPSTGPTLLADKFGAFLNEPAPNSADVWDLSRWMLAKQYRSSRDSKLSHKIRMELACGVMEFGISRGATAFTVVMESLFVERLHASGWRYRRLSAPIPYENGKGEALAVYVEAGPHILAATREAGQIFHDVLFEITPESEIDASTHSDTALRDAMRRAGSSETQHALRSLSDEIARLAEIDPGGSIAVIHGFQETLTERLSLLSREDDRLTG